jgi:hypothetical protein
MVSDVLPDDLDNCVLARSERDAQGEPANRIQTVCHRAFAMATTSLRCRSQSADGLTGLSVPHT